MPELRSCTKLPSSEYLVKNKIAAPGKVAINGGSNGGKPTLRRKSLRVCP